LNVNKYKLFFVLQGHEARSLTLRECHSLRNFENKALRKLFMPKREELRVDYRKYHNDEPPAFNSPHTDRVVKQGSKRWAGRTENRNTYRVLVGRCDAKRTLGRHRRRWKDIKMNLKRVESGSVDWINLVQERGK
jgi:hypothetical protein